VDEHQDGPVLDAEFEEGPLELVTIRHPGNVVGWLGRLEVDGDDLGALTLGAPSLVRARVDEQSVEPRVEPLAFAQPAQVSPRPDQRLLDRVLGCVRIAQDPGGDGEQAVVGGGRQGIERLMVAALRSFDEIGRHPMPRCPAGPIPAADEYGVKN